MKTTRLFLMIWMAALCACSLKNGDEEQGQEETWRSEDPKLVEAPAKVYPDTVRGAPEPTEEAKVAETESDLSAPGAQGGYLGKSPGRRRKDSRRYKLGRPSGSGRRYRESRSFDYHEDWGRNDGRFHNESYGHLGENPFLRARENPLSTFSLDVDTASYANVRRFINQGTLPPRDAVRIEELVNYFKYDYPAPRWGKPFGASVEVARAPWAREHKLVRVAIRARSAKAERYKPSNLVFLLDVSGSMSARNKLPLVKQSMLTLLKSLGRRDRVAIVVYSGAARIALKSTPASRRYEIADAIRALRAGGSTAGGAGINLAYSVARKNFVRAGINRVILCTDGDFNVGVSDEGTLARMIEAKAKSGVFLTVLGFGMGNLKDSMLEKLSNKGNGIYGYIDNEREARKFMRLQVQGTLVAVAKDVKLQVEFNPAKVKAYRLIGYENRMLRNKDFRNDRKDAGDVGAGHCVTAFYEVVPRGAGARYDSDDDLRYGDWRTMENVRDVEEVPNGGDEMLFVKIRYKEPNGRRSKLLTFPVRDTGRDFRSASPEFKFAAAVAEFGLVLRDSQYREGANLGQAYRIASANVGRDTHGFRREFLELVKKAEHLTPQPWTR